VTETAICFEHDGLALRGILHDRRDPPAPRTGVILLHGWSGCRLGPHRMFVTLARRLAAQGYACLRFDFSGRGESDGSPSLSTIETMTRDTAAAIRSMREQHDIDRIVLLGICSGAKVAISAAQNDCDVQHLVLWSAEAMGNLRSHTTRARRSWAALQSYARKIMNPNTWRRLLTGQVNVGMVGKAVAQSETPGDAERRRESEILDRFHTFSGEILFIYGSRDPDTDSAAHRYADFCRQSGIKSTFHEIPDANHSFYGLEWEEQVIGHTESWLVEHCRVRAANTMIP